MVDRERIPLAVLLALLIYPNDNFGGAFQPEFRQSIANLTVPLGRDATFTCHVDHLGQFKVGWVKTDNKAIQAIHDRVITHNPRVSVSRGDHSMWNLHIKGVQLDDAGLYMCQINTDPMKSQTGMLSIEVPPDFVAEETSGDVMINEGGQTKLTCRARGVPMPRVTWRREDNKDIVIREAYGGSVASQKTHGNASSLTRVSTLSATILAVSSMQEFQGEVLRLSRISRTDMGAYLCIASNGVPPAISKRIIVSVHFPPVIHVPNQLVSAPLGTDVMLVCYVEAFPMSINYWVKDNGAIIISSARLDVQAVPSSNFEVKMILTIRNLQKHDTGSYVCAAKNSLGEVEGSIRLYDLHDIQGATKSQTAYYDEKDEVVFGSAEIEKSENKPYSIDNTVHGHLGYPSVSSLSPTGTNRKRPGLPINATSGSRKFFGTSMWSEILIFLVIIVS
ncbi:lachesin [Orussus abietinus]|uniref:lachesin n=1 Tax=Orussus abietinus TaxID=222816 RepID=UPI000C715BC3|nr:lachesin [Orussus abietinus]